MRSTTRKFVLWSLIAVTTILVAQSLFFKLFDAGGLHIPTHARTLAPKGAACSAASGAGDDAVAAVVMVAYNRPGYMKQSFESLLSAHRKDTSFRKKFPLFISQDGKDKRVRDFARSLAPDVTYINHIEERAPVPPNRKERIAYYRIANHYKFIMQQLFDCRNYERLIIVEDDMLFAPDFFPYFEATAKILDEDRSLWCVSSWNDHGQKRLTHEPRRIVRSDFFPGLGWMLRRDTWNSLRDSWPQAYWDDWMRTSPVRKGRQCLRPEVCRTYNFGAEGSSSGQFYKMFLVPIRLNTESIPWQQMDLTYLINKTYDVAFKAALKGASEASSLRDLNSATGVFKVTYRSQRHYEAIAGYLRMIKEWKDGIPRGAYQGTVPVNLNEGATLVYITPAANFKVTTEKHVAVDAKGGALMQKETARAYERW